MEFGKILLIADYVIMIALVILSFFGLDAMITVGWIAQVGVSTGFYYWKAKNENRIKIPIKILQSIHKDFDNVNLDLTQIITSIIDKD